MVDKKYKFFKSKKFKVLGTAAFLFFLIKGILWLILGGSLITFYILSLITVGSVIYSEFLYKFFKNGKK